MNFIKGLVSFLGFREESNIQHGEISSHCKPENRKIYLSGIKEAIAQENFTFLYDFLNSDFSVQQLIHGSPGIYHNILHRLIIKESCTVPDAESKYREILLRLISVGKVKHFKIKQQVRMPQKVRHYDREGWEEWEVWEDPGPITLLMDAIILRASYKIICALINAGSDVSASTKNGTPLIYAFKYHYDINVFNELLKKGSNVNQRDHKGQTALFHAVDYRRDRKYMTMLINAGANVCERDDNRRNILMCGDCYCCLYEGDYVCTMKEKADILINNGINTKDIDIHGNTLTHLTFCRYLLNLSVKYGVNAKNHDGKTALTETVISGFGNEAKVDYLIRSGADPNDLDQELNTPLHLVFARLDTHKNIAYRVINSLLYYSADLYFHNAEGQTPLDILFNINDFHTCSNCHGEDGVQGSLMYILLYDENELKKRQYFFNNLYDPIHHNVESFLEKCKKELNLMQQMYINDGLTYYDFCILKKFYKSKFVPFSCDEFHLKGTEVMESFPIYKAVILIRLNDCYFKTKSLHLRKRFEKITFGLLMVTEVDTYIELDYDCFYHICRYLSTEDMHNVFSAAIGDSQV